MLPSLLNIINVNGLRQVGTAHLRACIVNIAIPIALNVFVANDGACVNMTAPLHVDSWVQCVSIPSISKY